MRGSAPHFRHLNAVHHPGGSSSIRKYAKSSPIPGYVRVGGDAHSRRVDNDEMKMIEKAFDSERMAGIWEQHDLSNARPF